MKTLPFQLLFLLAPLALFAQNAKIDSLRRVIEVAKVDTVKGSTLCRLCVELQNAGDLEGAEAAARAGIRLMEQGDPLARGVCIYRLGGILFSMGASNDALKTYQESLEIIREKGQRQNVASVLNSMGLVYKSQGAYTKALQQFQESYKIAEELEHLEGMAAGMNNIGLIHADQGALDKALKNFEKCLELMEQTGDQLHIAATLNNMGAILQSQGKIDEALDHLTRSMEIKRRIGDRAGEAASLDNMGLLNGMQGDYGTALRRHEESLAIWRSVGDRPGEVTSLVNLCSACLNLKRLEAARSHASKALSQAQAIGHLELKRASSQCLYQVDSTLGDWKAAFEAHRLYKIYSDSLKNDDQSKELGRLESKYEFERAAEEEKRLANEKARIEAERTERRNSLQYLSIFAALIALFGALVFLGRFSVSVRLMDVALFAGLLILFEYLLVLFDPVIDDLSKGMPLYKLAFNTGFAVVLAPLHHFSTRALRRRLLRKETAGNAEQPPADSAE